jgi:hypothetical protein
VSESRDERRRKARAEEQKRQEEIDKKLDEPKLPSFEAPASGHIVEDPPRRKPRGHVTD